MRDGDIEPTVVPRNPLDVLAQQIVAIVATGDEWKVPELHETVRRAHPFAELSPRAARQRARHARRALPVARSSPSCARASSGTGWRTRSGRARARSSSRSRTPGTIPDRGLYGVHLPDGRRVGELDEEMVYEARPGQTFLLGASTWRIEEITRDRVIVTPAPGAPGRRAVLAGRRHRPPEGAGRGDRRLLPRAVDREPAELAAEYDLDERAANNLSAFLREQRDATRVVPSDRTIVGGALPRRDRRLAPVRALAVRRPRARGLGAGAVGAHPRRVRPRVRRDLVGRRDHRPPSRRRRAALRRAGDGRAGRGGGAGGARAVELRAVRRPLPRERRPRPAAAARVPRQAHPALAAAAQGAVAARGGQALRPVPDRARDLPRVPARRARPARPGGSCCAASTRASCRSSRWRPSAPLRSPRRCCSTTSRRTCTRATRRTRSGAPRRCRSTASCCASCSARRSCAS